MSPHTQPPSAKRPGATGYTLLQAVREGDLASAKQMLASNPGLLHFETYDRRTALHVACAEGHTHILRLLLSLDSDISRRDRWGRTCVTEAALNGRVQVLRMLVEQGSGDVWNGFERMVMGVRTGQALGRDLLCVVGEGGVTGAEQLVRHFCANVNYVNEDGRTPLHVACVNGDIRMAGYLVGVGADTQRRDRWGVCAVEEALRCGHDDVARVVEKA